MRSWRWGATRHEAVRGRHPPGTYFKLQGKSAFGRDTRECCTVIRNTTPIGANRFCPRTMRYAVGCAAKALPCCKPS